MSEKLVELLLRGIRRLSPEEQEELLRGLLSDRIELATALGSAAPRAPGHVTLSLAEMLPTGSLREHEALRELLTGMGGGGPWQTVPVRLPVELHERLKQWCQRNNFTMAVVLRGLVARFLDEYGRPSPAEGGERAEPA
jgi:hypothetical protein